MVDVVVQASFNSGEWSPKLYSRVDLAKYRSGAALLENFFVDYRGGASTRTGTKYILQAYKSASQVRLIPFQASFTTGYILEFGNGYVRFFFQGAPIVEAGIAITGATQANPCVLTIPGNNYAVGDWINVTGVVGMTQLNAQYFSVLAVAGASVTIGDLNGNAIDSTGYSGYVSGGSAARVYTIPSPYTSADDLRLIKFALSINQMILCHPNYAPYILTLVAPANWTLVPISIGASINAPTGLVTASTTAAAGKHYSYGVTSIDAKGQESSMSTPQDLNGSDIRTTAGSNSVTWTAVAGAFAYNVYATSVSYFGVLPAGVEYGFIGTTKGTTFIDSNIGPDFTEAPPTAQQPFLGAGVKSVTITAPGTYTVVPTVTFTGVTPAITATGIVQLQVNGTPTITSGGGSYAIGDQLTFANGLVTQVTAVSGGVITAWIVVNPGAVTSGSTPANPLNVLSTTGHGFFATATATWGVGAVVITQSGAGYSSVPTVTFSSGAATATAVLTPAVVGFPTVPSFIQQRLVLASTGSSPQTFYMSQPGQYFNYNTTTPAKADDAITGTLASQTLNTIKHIVGVTTGMLILTDKASWIVNGGSPGSAITPTSIVANPQSYVGSSDVPPIVTNYDVLYVQSKGSAVRDLAFNIYFNSFTGTDISTISSHLFYGYTIEEWAWAEQPFYLAQAVRNDGVMLSLTFLKEQEFVGWTHFTTNGAFNSVATVTEVTDTAGKVDAVYTVVQRTINGNVVQYIERFAERAFPNGVADAWCVDAAVQYVGAPATTFSGAKHLAGAVVTGLADGVVIPPFTMPVSGNFTLATPASKVTVGLGFTCKLQTLGIDIGEPSVQGKVKKITGVNIRVADTLGLKIGPDFNHLVPINDLIVGKVSGMATGLEVQLVSGLVTGNAFSALAPTYSVPGQYCIQQSDPLPATITGVFPEIVLGDDR